MPAHITPCTWRNLPALRLTGDRLEVVLTLVGGQLASLRRRGEELDPMWQPAWTGLDPTALSATQIATFAGPAAAPLLASIVGSNLCCDRFGAPPPGEDKPVHGEICRTRLQQVADAGAEVAIEGRLALAGLIVRRAVSLDGDACILTTTVRHDGAAVRDIEWCEHTNLGGRFLDTVDFAAPLDRVVVTSHRDDGERFAADPVGLDIDPAAALRFPRPDEAPCGDVLTGRIATGPAEAAWTAVNRTLGRRFTCVFQRADWPWLALWTQHRSRRASPWNGLERVRGMELSTKPIPEAVVPPERRGAWLGRPTTCLIPPGPGLSKRLVFRWEDLSG
ncbi:MAG TPA: hypothetical protein DCS97_02510 [Planctomycetes bacterium]|nr:hypothetical protein [Planctomycetota bacterium]